MTVKPQILYITIILYIVIIFSTVMLGSTGILTIERKNDELARYKDRVEMLRGEMKQINNDIRRFQTDREYLISSAKVYGYLEGGGKEKIVRVLEYDDSKVESEINLADSGLNVRIMHNRPHSSTNGFLIILFISIASIVIYLFIKSKIGSKSSNFHRS